MLLRIDPRQRDLKAANARYGDLLLGRHTVVEEARFRSRVLKS